MRFVLFAGGLAALSGCFLFSQGPTVVEMRPGETMPELRDRVRTLPQEERAKGVKVVVPPGRYAFADSLVLDARDSGTPEAPVVWCAKDPSDKPVFVSGVEQLQVFGEDGKPFLPKGETTVFVGGGQPGFAPTMSGTL